MFTHWKPLKSCSNHQTTPKTQLKPGTLCSNSVKTRWACSTTRLWNPEIPYQPDEPMAINRPEPSHFIEITRFYRLSIDFNRIEQSFTVFYWVSLGFTGFYWVLLGFTGCHRVLPGLTGFYLVFTGFYWVLLGFTGFYLVFFQVLATSTRGKPEKPKKRNLLTLIENPIRTRETLREPRFGVGTLFRRSVRF